MSAQLLLQSDQAYFSSGARNTEVYGGVFSHIPGHETSPAGCILHSLRTRETDYHEEWLSGVTALFRDSGARMVRIYLQEDDDPALTPLLVENSYQCRPEIGLSIPLSELGPQDERVSLVECQKEYFRAKEAEFIREMETAPDGHRLLKNSYAEIEDIKVDSGYMIPFFLEHNGETIGSVKLAIEGPLARMKNLIVADHYRRKGIATSMVLAIADVARTAGVQYLGAYALEHHGSLKMYRKLGMQEVTRQHEWTREICQPAVNR